MSFMSSGLDIQQFVGRVDVLRASLWPVLWIYPILCDLINWVAPLYSALTLACLCIACLFVEHWMPLLFLGLSCTLVFGYVKFKAYGRTVSRTQRGFQYQPRYLDNTAHFLDSCHQDVLKTEESIRKFRSLIVQLQDTVLHVILVAEELRTLFYWHHPRRSLRYLVGSMLVSIMYWLISWRLSLLVVVIWSFTVNGCMVEIITERLTRFWKRRESPPRIVVSDTTKDRSPSVANGQPHVRHVRQASESSDDEEIDVLSMNQVKLDESSDSSNETTAQSSPANQGSVAANTPNLKVAKSSALSRFLRRRKTKTGLPANSKPVKPRCFTCNKSLGSSHVCCSNCGDTFCERCCSNRVPRASLGATSPAAYAETVPVCGSCYLSLQRH